MVIGDKGERIKRIGMETRVGAREADRRQGVHRAVGQGALGLGRRRGARALLRLRISAGRSVGHAPRLARAGLRAAPLRLERVEPDPGGLHAAPRAHRAGGQGRQAAELQLPPGAAAAAAAAAELRRRRRDPHAQGRRMDGRPCDADRRGAAVGLLRQRTAAAPAGARRSRTRRCSTPTPAWCRCWPATMPARRRPRRRRRCAPSSCCCCARSACCPSLDAQTADAGAAGRRRALQRWCPRPACARPSDDEAALAGADWQALQAALDDRAPFTATLRCVAS